MSWVVTTNGVFVPKLCELWLFLREFSLDVSVEMPNEISYLQCLTHKVQIKVSNVAFIYTPLNWFHLVPCFVFGVKYKSKHVELCM